MRNNHPCATCPPLRAGLQTVWTHCEPDLRDCAARLCQQPALIDDLMHETYLKCHRYWPPSHRDNLCGWMYRVLSTTWIDNFRREKRQAAEELPESRTDERVPNPIDQIALKQCLEKLMRRNRRRYTVLTMYYLEGWQQKEIAEHYGVSESFIRQEVGRSLKYLRQCCQEGVS